MYIGYVKTKEMEESEKIVKIPLYIAEQMLETYRLLDTVYHCATRESCLHRHVMRDWMSLDDIVKKGEINVEDCLTYYTEKGLTPFNKKNKN